MANRRDWVKRAQDDLDDTVKFRKRTYKHKRNHKKSLRDHRRACAMQK